jgi:hypothetical protein
MKTSQKQFLKSLHSPFASRNGLVVSLVVLCLLHSTAAQWVSLGDFASTVQPRSFQTSLLLSPSDGQIASSSTNVTMFTFGGQDSSAGALGDTWDFILPLSNGNFTHY